MAMSGGIDSSVAAMLLLEQGCDLVGVTFRTYDGGQTSGCGNISAADEAAAIAAKLGIQHHVADFRQLFHENVVCNFINEYMHGRTPNPCVLCNSTIKWGFLLKLADELGCSHIATGHYAKIVQHQGHWHLAEAADKLKDQTYFLWMLTEENLSRTIFPLGDFTKEQIRQMAAERGFVKLSQKEESQEICFIPDNNYRHFLAEHVPDFEQKCVAGDFLDTHGKIVGKHEGFPNYTIGQRKGLKVAFGVPKYVVSINADKNQVVLGDREDLYQHELVASHCRCANLELLGEGHCLARIRYRSKATAAKITVGEPATDNLTLKINFDEAVWGVTPGQSLVIYHNGMVIGGGIID